MERTVLLVDDVRLFLEMQREFLQYSTVQIVTARNGVEALNAIRAQRPNLVFMDLEMPEMDGVSCCRIIKSDPSLSDIPVVMITAKGDQASQDMCRDAGCDEFLTKPLNRSLFLETAGRFVAGINRREHRAQTSLQGAVRSRGTSFPCTLDNLSIGGAFIATDFPGETDRMVEISFTLPDGSLQECRAKIIWTREAGHQGLAGFGVNFVLLQAEVKRALCAFLQRSLRPPLS